MGDKTHEISETYERTNCFMFYGGCCTANHLQGSSPRNGNVNRWLSISYQDDGGEFNRRSSSRDGQQTEHCEILRAEVATDLLRMNV